MFEAFLISIAANLATAAGAKALSLVIDDSICRKIETAFSKAVKKWCVNSHIADKESIWTRKRLEELADLMANPAKENEIDKRTIELLRLFKIELQKDDTTWHYLEGEFYKNLMSSILDVQKSIEIIQEEINSKKINPISLKEKLIDQTNYQISKNIISGKYIPDTFLEVSELKEHIRCFTGPFLFYKRVYEKICLFNFDFLNRRLQKEKKETFAFNVEHYKVESTDNFESLYNLSNTLLSYLNSKHDELYNGGNHKWAFSSKLRRRKDDVEFINKRLCILTANAGQGKTNFICDFAANVLVKRNIPSLYVNGYEVDASNIENSISHAVYPTNAYTFGEILEAIKEYCTYTKKPFVIIIDGLNENSTPQLLCSNLCRLIKELSNHKFVKIILTCRTEYYKEQFSSIGQTYVGETIIVDHIHAHLNESQKDRLIDNYLNYFKISVSLSDDIRDELTENLLLLRIFAESYQNQTLSYISDLHKDELFNVYYRTMCDNISKKISTDGYPSLNTHVIHNFIGRIIEYMVDQQCFTNIPICNILNTSESSQIALYNKFLDENIILRRDLITSSGIFGTTEVINFTYDEFRDYLVSCYLVDGIYPKSEAEFKTFVIANTQNNQRLAEGIRSFLFLIAKKHTDKRIIEFLKTLDWYKNVFLNHIWEIDDKFIDDTDIKLIEELLPKHNKQIIPRLMFRGRWDTRRFTKININILLKFLSSLDDNHLRKMLYLVWVPEYDYYNRDSKQFDRLLDIHEELLSDHELFKNIEAHNIFEFFLYLTPFSYRAEDIYASYLDKFGHKDLLLRVKKECNSKHLKNTIDNILGQQ